MKARPHILSPSVARRIAILCAAVIVASAQTARAGINVWTSHGPGTVHVTALAIDPTTSSTLYAALGVASFGVAGRTDGGISKSTDGGGSWQAVNVGLPDKPYVGALALDPMNPSTLYAVAAGEVYKSTDGAGSWSAVGFFATALAIDPSMPSTLYAGTGRCFTGVGDLCLGDGVFKSTDGGNTWDAANAGLAVNAYVTALAIAPTAPSTLYAATYFFGGDRRAAGTNLPGLADNGLSGTAVAITPGAFGLSKSTDGGTTWSNAGLGPYISNLALDPITPTTLYAVRDGGVYKSTDSGGSWSAVLGNQNAYALAISASTPSTLYAGTEGGVFKSTDGASSWAPFNPGLPRNTGVSALAIDPIAPATVYAGTEGGGVFDIEQFTAHVVGTGTAASCTDSALTAALASGGLVTFNCGGPATIDISTGTGTKTIAIDTIIDGGGLITISGGNTVQVFNVNSGVHFTVVNLTIANGRGAVGGGGIATSDGTLTITNSTFIDNDTAGVYYPAFGGALYSDSGTLTVTNSTFTGNFAEVGGGIYKVSGVLTVTNSTFTGNRATGYINLSGSGGGIYSGVAQMTIINSTFTGNTATSGAGSTSSFGGGIASFGDGSLTNSTFTGNSAAAGGISNRGQAELVLRNTIVANSPFGGNCDGTITDGGHNLDDDTSCGFSTANGSLSDTDPQLDPAGLQDNGGPTQTVALCTAAGVPPGCTAASPAIDAGGQAVCAAAPVSNLDQRGVVRPGVGYTQCSIGAYEADGPSPVCGGDCDGTGSVTIDEVLTLVNIALGTAQPSACLHGIPSGADVNVALIIQAVNNALSGCGV